MTQRSIGVELAVEAARAALAEGQTRGYGIAVAVVDRAGHLLVLLRDDRGGPHLIESAQRKAYTAASSKNHTTVLSQAIDARSGVPDPHLVYLDSVLMVGGGVPILSDGEVIGAIGVGGSPGSVHDEECAMAGIRHIEAALTPTIAGDKIAKPSREHLDELLDEALDESFPASDPEAIHVDR